MKLRSKLAAAMAVLLILSASAALADTVAPNGLAGVIPLLPPGITEAELIQQQGRASVADSEAAASSAPGVPLEGGNVFVALDAGQVEKVLQDLRNTPQSYPFTYDDIVLTARLIYAEGKVQSDESFRAMASVVYNRYRSKRYPNTIEKIVFQRNQFTVVDDEDFLTDVPTASAFSAVIDVFINGNATLPENVLYFRSERDNKKWGSREYYDTIGGNMYYS